MSSFDYQQLDDVIHSRIRLSAMAILAGLDDAEFSFLRDRIGATDGNLGAHMRKLEEAGYVKAIKEFADRKPVTRYSMTAKGRDAFKRYIERVERLLGGAGTTEEE